jgi:heavy metal efflux system protein
MRKNNQYAISKMQLAKCNFLYKFLPFALCPLRLSLCLLLFAICPLSYAQQNITIEKAIQTATNNSLTIKEQKQTANYLQKLTKTAYDIPSTNFGGELGQVNSNYFDAKIGVAQAIKFPIVYKKQKEVLVQESKIAELNEALQKKEITKQVTIIFYEMVYLLEKEKLLKKVDTIYNTFLNKATLRFNKGETNILEKTTAENQVGQIKIQLNQLKNDYIQLQNEFKFLLNVDTNYTPNYTTCKLSFADSLSNAVFTIQPQIKLLELETNINNAKIALEKTKKLPELNGGLYLQSFRDGNNFKASNLGAYIQLGLAFPFFNTSVKNKLKAMEVINEITETKIAIEKKNLQNSYTQKLAEYKKHKETVQYYENELLKNISLINSTANKKFSNGDINYLEWVMLINQNTELENNYIDAIKKMNDAIIVLQNFKQN